MSGFAIQNWAVVNGWQVDQTVVWPDCECCEACGAVTYEPAESDEYERLDSTKS